MCTHIFLTLYMYMCVCVCVCLCHIQMDGLYHWLSTLHMSRFRAKKHSTQQTHGCNWWWKMHTRTKIDGSNNVQMYKDQLGTQWDNVSMTTIAHWILEQQQDTEQTHGNMDTVEAKSHTEMLTPCGSNTVHDTCEWIQYCVCCCTLCYNKGTVVQ